MGYEPMRTPPYELEPYPLDHSRKKKKKNSKGSYILS